MVLKKPLIMPGDEEFVDKVVKEMFALERYYKDDVLAGKACDEVFGLWEELGLEEKKLRGRVYHEAEEMYKFFVEREKTREEDEMLEGMKEAALQRQDDLLPEDEKTEDIKKLLLNEGKNESDEKRFNESRFAHKGTRK